MESVIVPCVPQISTPNTVNRCSSRLSALLLLDWQQRFDIRFQDTAVLLAHIRNGWADQYAIVHVQRVQRPVDEWREKVEEVIARREARQRVENVLVNALSEEDGVGEAHRKCDTAREKAETPGSTQRAAHTRWQVSARCKRPLLAWRECGEGEVGSNPLGQH